MSRRIAYIAPSRRNYIGGLATLQAVGGDLFPRRQLTEGQSHHKRQSYGQENASEPGYTPSLSQSLRIIHHRIQGLGATVRRGQSKANILINAVFDPQAIETTGRTGLQDPSRLYC